ncbi:hypothetical protein C8Q76DRAFT_792771 [Earliella scabrosa]|nr:hypothetical protein C8Q76DRAFT_792771 [Earliella scabrosa]
MSADSGSTDVAIAMAAESMIRNYCGMAGIVFLLYEYTITIGQEVDLFWTRRFSGATILFIANKYLTLLNHLFDISLYIPFHVSDKTLVSCDLHAKAFSSLDYLQYVPWAAFSGLRAYALSRQWWLSSIVTLLSLVPLGVNFSVKIYGVNDPDAGCGMGETIDPLSLTASSLVLIARTCLIAADILLILITWYYLPRRDITKILGQGALSFGNIVLRDGTIYFLILLIMNTLHIVFSFTSTSEMTYFTEPVTAVLVSRFLLHLQEMNQRSIKLDNGASQDHDPTFGESGAGDLKSMTFARVVGSLGTTIPLDAYTSTWRTSAREESGSSFALGSESTLAERDQVELVPVP